MQNFIYLKGENASLLTKRLKESVPYYVENSGNAAMDDSRKFMARFIVSTSELNAYDVWRLRGEMDAYGSHRMVVVLETDNDDMKKLMEELKTAGVHVYKTVDEVAEFLNAVHEG